MLSENGAVRRCPGCLPGVQFFCEHRRSTSSDSSFRALFMNGRPTQNSNAHGHTQLVSVIKVLRLQLYAWFGLGRGVRLGRRPGRFVRTRPLVITKSPAISPENNLQGECGNALQRHLMSRRGVRARHHRSAPTGHFPHEQTRAFVNRAPTALCTSTAPNTCAIRY